MKNKKMITSSTLENDNIQAFKNDNIYTMKNDNILYTMKNDNIQAFKNDNVDVFIFQCSGCYHFSWCKLSFLKA
jgi:hypothetical protein